nr:hypothetical protein [Tanacetum cinerariifolium]
TNDVADVVAHADAKPTPPSSTPTTTPPPPQQEVTSTSPSSPHQSPIAPSSKVEALEQDKIAQALEITKLKQRVRKLERENKLKVSRRMHLNRGREIALIDADEDVIIEEVDATKDDEVEKNADVHGRLEEKVEALEQDKIAQALEITKLKQRVRKLERENKLKVSRLRRLKKVETAQRVESSAYTVMDDQED